MSNPVAKCAMRFEIAEDTPQGTFTVSGVWTFHAQKSESAAPFSAADLLTLTGRAYQWWADADMPDGVSWMPLRSAMPTFMRLVDIETTPIQPSLGEPSTTPVVGDEYGDGFPIFPPQCCIGIGLRTTEDTRNHRGRIYLPAPEAFGMASQSLGVLSTTYQDVIAGWAAHLAYRVRGGEDPTPEMVLAVYSRVLGTSQAVTHFDIPHRLLTQRRRAIEPIVHTHYGLDGVVSL